ncbi:MAG: hypothetical protein OXI87_19990, partial [Albidovulum sp.]|nr:hypothetical protein [Albidovulum sp.]
MLPVRRQAPAELLDNHPGQEACIGAGAVLDRGLPIGLNLALDQFAFFPYQRRMEKQSPVRRTLASPGGFA